MKRSCKNIDITDWHTIEPWVYCCIDTHKERYDFQRLLCTIGGMDKKEYAAALKSQNKKPWLDAAKLVAKEAAKRIEERNLNLPAVRIREKIDRSSGKIRLIGKESAMQLILDNVADHASEEIWRRRIVPQQVSSIKDRGPLYGVRMIQRWVKKDNQAARWAENHGVKYSRRCKYYVKLDISKCYQSMRHEVFLKCFRQDCGNEELLWLWEELLKSHRVNNYKGFMIGAPTSQSAAQYILSFIYRYIMSLHKERRGKRIKLVAHSLFYMDDIFICGPDRRNLKMAVRKAIKYAKDEFGLTIKPGWHIQELEKTPIDMMGYVIHADGSVTVRPRIFLRARRMALRCLRKGLSFRQAQRISSYKGYFVQKKKKYKELLDSRKIMKKLKLKYVFETAQKVIRNRIRRENESILQPRTRADPVHAAPGWKSRCMAQKEHHPGNR